MCLWDFEASMCVTAWKINWCFTWNTDRGNSWKGEVCFPNGYFQLSFRDFVIAIVSRETWWVGGWVVGDGFGVCLPSPTSCCEDWCFTWNHSSNTTKIYWTPRNNIRFPNLTHSYLLSANQEFTIHQHNHPHKQLWINSSVSRETLAFS